jgi:hypothetical protein
VNTHDQFASTAHGVAPARERLFGRAAENDLAFLNPPQDVTEEGSLEIAV